MWSLKLSALAVVAVAILPLVVAEFSIVIPVILLVF